MFFDILSHWKPLELEEGYHWWLPFWAAATWTKITAGIFVDLANLLPDNIQPQEINSKRFWRENWWLVAFGYSVCCGVSKKCHQGSKRQREPITIELMHIIFQSLNFYNHTMLWAACCLGFFGFLHVVEFTVNSHFNPNIAVSDVQAESLVNSGSIKCSKMDSFC